MTQHVSAENIRASRRDSKAVVVSAKLANIEPPLPGIFIDLKPRTKRKAQPLQDRIDRLTDKSAGPDSDWRWLGSRNQSSDYPQISYRDPDTGKQVTRPVHRVLMELKLGRKLNRDELVLHRRGVSKQSVNPAHLRVGTREENTADAIADGRYKSSLTKEQVLKIVSLRQRHGLSIADIAERFNVKSPTVRNILQGRTHAKTTGIEYAKKQSGRPKKAALKVDPKPKRVRHEAPRSLGAVA